MSFRTHILALAAATLSALPAFADGFEVVEPHARAASPAAKSGAVFVILRNMTGQDDRLVTARTDAAKRAALHSHMETGDGIVQMREIEGGIPVADGEMIEMKRGGQHVMLMGLTGPLEQGAEIEVTLVFEKAGEVVVTVPVDNDRAPEPGAHSN